MKRYRGECGRTAEEYTDHGSSDCQLSTTVMAGRSLDCGTRDRNRWAFEETAYPPYPAATVRGILNTCIWRQISSTAARFPACVSHCGGGRCGNALRNP